MRPWWTVLLALAVSAGCGDDSALPDDDGMPDDGGDDNEPDARVAGEPLTGVVELAPGYQHVCALLEDHSVVCWGANELGSGGEYMGTSSHTNHCFEGPGPVAPLPGSFVQLVAGEAHTCGRAEDGTVTCWGLDDEQQATDVATPGAIRIAAGGDFVANGATLEGSTCAIYGDRVECWGSNEYGQLANSTAGGAPEPIAALADMQEIALSYAHGCGIDRTNAIACWGAGNRGQRGTGETTGSYTPAPVIGALTGTAVAVAPRTTCAVAIDQTVYCWGERGAGETGTGAGADVLVPTQVPGIANVVDVTLGRQHACVIRTDGSVWCWGSGILGDATLPAMNSMAVQVPGITGATAIAAGPFFTCAIVEGGQVMCWGSSSCGETGVDEATYAPRLIETAQ